MKTIILFVMAFVLLAISQSAGAQVTTAQIREEIAKGECETAQSLYNVYKAMNGANKTIEREIADCKTDSSSGFGETGTANGHEYVDLGLPSGTLWATCNVGASKPEDYGNYYAWGETKVKSVYNDETYKYCNVNWDNVFGLKAFGINNLTKYCNNSSYGNNGFTDNQTMLEGCDDVANTNWGNGWHIPTKAQWNELLKYTTNQWTTQNGVNGTLFTAKTGRHSSFLPLVVVKVMDLEMLALMANTGRVRSTRTPRILRGISSFQVSAIWHASTVLMAFLCVLSERNSPYLVTGKTETLHRMRMNKQNERDTQYGLARLM